MKKIIIYFLGFMVLSNPLFADSAFVFNVHSNAQAEALFDILNGIAGMFSSNVYLDMLKMVFTFGMFLSFATVVLYQKNEQGLIQFAKHGMVAMGILTLVFSYGRATIIVETKQPTYISNVCLNDPAQSTNTSYMVSNIPYLFAYGISVMHEIGYTSTELFETAFYPATKGVSSPSIGDTGGLAQSLKDFTVMLNNAPNNTISRFIYQCIEEVAAQKPEGEEILKKMDNSGNLKATIEEILNTTVTTGENQKALIGNFPMEHFGSYYPCGYFWKQKILNDSNLTEMFNTFQCINGISDVRAKAALSFLDKDKTGIPQSNFQEMAIQAGILNSYIAAKDFHTGIGITSAQSGYGAGKTQAQLVQEGIGSSVYFSKNLPILQALFEGIIIAIFPFIIVVSVLPAGTSILKNYAKSVLWIQLWNPVTAVLNYFIATFATASLGNIFKTMDGINILNSSMLLSDAAGYIGAAGYMYALVPPLSWMLLTGSAQMLENFTQGLQTKLNGNLTTQSINEDRKLTQKALDNGQNISTTQMEEAKFVGIAEGVALKTQRENGEQVTREQAKRDVINKQAEALYSSFGAEETGYLKQAGMDNNLQGTKSSIENFGSKKAMLENTKDLNYKEVIEKQQNAQFANNLKENKDLKDGYKAGIDFNNLLSAKATQEKMKETGLDLTNLSDSVAKKDAYNTGIELSKYENQKDSLTSWEVGEAHAKEAIVGTKTTQETLKDDKDINKQVGNNVANIKGERETKLKAGILNKDGSVNSKKLESMIVNPNTWNLQQQEALIKEHKKLGLTPSDVAHSMAINNLSSYENALAMEKVAKENGMDLKDYMTKNFTKSEREKIAGTIGLKSMAEATLKDNSMLESLGLNNSKFNSKSHSEKINLVQKALIDKSSYSKVEIRADNKLLTLQQTQDGDLKLNATDYGHGTKGNVIESEIMQNANVKQQQQANQVKENVKEGIGAINTILNLTPVGRIGKVLTRVPRTK